MGPSTYESVGASEVNSRSKLAVSLASACTIVSKSKVIYFTMCTYHVGLEAGLVLPLQKFTPVNAVEEVVRLDLSRALGSQTLLCVAVEQTSEEVACSRGNDLRPREVQRLGENLAVHIVGVLVVERRETSQHLVEKDTQCPPIYRLRVATTGEKLGSKVFGRTTEC